MLCHTPEIVKIAGNHFGTERNVTFATPKLASKELIGPPAETSYLIIPQTITMEIKCGR